MSYVWQRDREEGGGEGKAEVGREAGGGGVMCAFVHGAGAREFDIDAQEIVPRRNLFWP